jgi:hypothetical protein
LLTAVSTRVVLALLVAGIDIRMAAIAGFVVEMQFV